jgi:hypothetical protein
MAQTTPPNAPGIPVPSTEQPCPHCHCHPASAKFGQQLMQHIEQLTQAERSQMLALIDRILASSQRQRQAKTTATAKRRKKR